MTTAITQLARDWVIQASLSTDGVNFVNVAGITDFAHPIKPTLQSTADYDTNGWDGSEITMQSWSGSLKFNRNEVAGVKDPGQEILRAAGSGQFGVAARAYLQWYRRSDGSEGRQGLALIDWNPSKTATADLMEVTVTFTGDGPLGFLPQVDVATVNPVIISVTPSGAGTGQQVTIVGSGFSSGVPAGGVKFGGTAATSFVVVSDSTIVAVLPTGSGAGAAAVTVTNSVGTSAAFAYTRAA